MIYFVYLYLFSQRAENYNEIEFQCTTSAWDNVNIITFNIYAELAKNNRKTIQVKTKIIKNK